MPRHDDTRYLVVADAVAIHAAIMERTGYAPAPLRTEAGLDSALRRAEAAAYYEGADLVRQATLLAAGVSQAPAFLDGNKRTACALLDVFLRLNGSMFNGDPVELAREMERVAERMDSLADATARFEAWLRARVASVSTQ